MKACIISFSGRKDGNCGSIAKELGKLYKTDVKIYSAKSFGRLSINGDLMENSKAAEAVKKFAEKTEEISDE